MSALGEMGRGFIKPEKAGEGERDLLDRARRGGKSNAHRSKAESNHFGRNTGPRENEKTNQRRDDRQNLNQTDGCELEQKEETSATRRKKKKEEPFRKNGTAESRIPHRRIRVTLAEVQRTIRRGVVRVVETETVQERKGTRELGDKKGKSIGGRRLQKATEWPYT